jgi:hypothetical protein
MGQRVVRLGVFWLLIVCAVSSARATTKIASLDVGIGNALRHGFPAVARVTVQHEGAETLNAQVVVKPISSQWRREGGRVEQDVTLPPHSRKQFELPLFFVYGAESVEAELRSGGQRIARQSVKVKVEDSGADFVATLNADDLEFTTPQDDDLSFRRAFTGLISRAPRPDAQRLNLSSWRDAPSQEAGYAMLGTLITVGAPSNVDKEQERALVRWLRHGGTLVVSAGDAPSALQQSFLAPLLPVTLTERTTAANLRPVALIAGDPRAPAMPQPLVICQPRRDARVIVGEAQTPWVVEGKVGKGRVIFLAFDPRREPFKGWLGKTEFWRTLLRWRHGQWQLPALPAPMLSEMPALIREAKVVNVPSRFLLLTPLAVYALVLVLAAVYTTRLARRKEMTWLVMGCLAVLFGFGYCGALRLMVTGQFYMTGVTLRMTQPDEGMASNWFQGTMFFPTRREMDVTLRAPLATFFLGERSELTHTLHVGDSFTRLRGIYPKTWSLEALTAHLETEDGQNIVAQGGGDGERFRYRITNRSRQTLRRGRVVLSHPQRYYAASVPDLAPGRSCAVAVNTKTAQQINKYGVSFPSVQRVYRKASPREQRELWVWEKGLHGLNWQELRGQQFGGVYIALADKPPCDVTVKGFKQEWHHLVLVPLRGEVTAARKEWEQQGVMGGMMSGMPGTFMGSGNLQSAVVLSHTLRVERVESENVWNVERGEMVLEYDLSDVPPRPADRQVFVLAHGRLSSRASLTLAAYNWRTGQWQGWKPALVPPPESSASGIPLPSIIAPSSAGDDAPPESHKLSLDFLHPVARAVRLKVTVKGPLPESHWQTNGLMVTLNPEYLDGGIGMPGMP